MLRRARFTIFESQKCFVVSGAEFLKVKKSAVGEIWQFSKWKGSDQAKCGVSEIGYSKVRSKIETNGPQPVPFPSDRQSVITASRFFVEFFLQIILSPTATLTISP